MKTPYLIISFLYLSTLCKAQINREKLTDSLTMLSRHKADIVLKHFDSFKTPKILYSIEGKYFYLIIKESPHYNEYYVTLDNSDEIGKVHLVEANQKNEKPQKHYEEILSKAEPIFDLNRYKKDLITKIPDAKMESGRSAYFVVQAIDRQRHGEFSLSAATLPSPIDVNLWIYLTMRLSDEIARNDD